MLDEKLALEVVKHKQQPQAQLVDARMQPDGTVEIFLDNELTPTFKVEVVVTDLKKAPQV